MIELTINGYSGPYVDRMSLTTINVGYPVAKIISY